MCRPFAAPRPLSLAALAVLCFAHSMPSLANDGDGKETVFEQNGRASWYGEDFEGKKTASGERFDPEERTAAHRSLPLGSEVTVTNPETGRRTQVEINDRGPYKPGRIIDLSRKAAEDLGIIDQGVAKVKVEATGEQLDAAKRDDAGQEDRAEADGH